MFVGMLGYEDALAERHDDGAMNVSEFLHSDQEDDFDYSDMSALIPRD
jgi:hypothetical protein